MYVRSSSKPLIKWRTIISLFTAWMFLIAGITGLVLYIVPQGRIAYWVDWRLLGLSKTDWGDVHIVATFLFLIAGAWHLYYNWRPFIGHLRRHAAHGSKIRKELLLVTTLALLVVAGALWRIPPLAFLIELNDAIKDSWIENGDSEPPFGHAELLTLDRFCQKTRIAPDLALAKLRREALSVETVDETLQMIAKNNKMSPKDIYEKIKVLQTKRPVARQQKGKLTPDDVFERYEGTGVGRRTVAEACAMAGEEIERCMSRIEHLDWSAVEDDSLKAIAAREGLRPIQILQGLLVDR